MDSSGHLSSPGPSFGFWNLGGMELLVTSPRPCTLVSSSLERRLGAKGSAQSPAGRRVAPGVSLQRPSPPHAPSAVSAATALRRWFPDHGVTKVSPGCGAGGHRGQRPRLLQEPNCDERGVFQPPTSANVENIRNEKTRNASL